MPRIRSDRRGAVGARVIATLALAAALGSTLTPAAAQAQQDGGYAGIISTEFSMSRENAELQLELIGGRTVQLAVRDGGAWIDGTRIGDAERGGELDRSWRELLTRGMDASSAELPQLLASWSPPDGVGAQMAGALRTGLTAGADESTSPASPAPSTSDSVSRLVERIAELERAVQQAERRATRVSVETRSRPARRFGPLHYVGEGLAGIFSTLVTYAVVFAIAFGVIAFGGRRHIEGVGDTARRATTRSLLVGLAAAFLVVPVFVLGILALVISIVGIPGLLVWVPGFPVAIVLASLLGYLGVAHAAGEAVAERRFYVTDWFRRGNSYYFLLTGLGLLLAFFLAASVVYMGGPWVRAISNLLTVFGVLTTVTAVLTGFGAVLISRGGTRPLRADDMMEEPDLFREEAGV